jgi:bacillithiol biosynthesis deacetylase BshB1
MAVGAHPDDVELFCGGTVAKMVGEGFEATILDLTRGEMGSFGNPEKRAAEARAAADILGTAGRVNLDLGDSALEETIPMRREVAAAIREHRPQIILAPHWEDQHPDHAAAGRTVREASLDARLVRLDLGHPPHAPGLVLFYPCHTPVHPTVVVDITGTFETKMEAIKAYSSQFDRESGGTGPPPVGIRDYIFHIESRCRHFGSLINRRYGEGFISPVTIEIEHPGLLLPPEQRIE